MADQPFPLWNDIRTIVFDFDGVFTDNKVWVGQDGTESVRCDRGDGLAFDLMRKFVKENNWKVDYFILSKEKNPVVASRANKLQIPCVQGISAKSEYLLMHLQEKKLDFASLIYVGNDLNDLAAIRLAGFSVAPCDAHPVIKQQASTVLPFKGGEGFVRAFVEKLLMLERLNVDELVKFI